MQGIININGYIGSFIDEKGNEVKGVDIIDVVTQREKYPLATSFLVNINSKGGVCTVGYVIYDYLKTLGLPITTVATGFCCSMASVIMMAGDERVAIEPLEFLPHNPWTSGVMGDADDILQAAEEMRAEEDKMIAHYSKATGVSKEAIDAIMKMDKAIPLDKAVELKFLTEIKSPLKAIAVLKNTNMSKEKETSSLMLGFQKTLNAITKALKISEPKAMKATTTDGKEVEFLNAAGEDFEGDPVAGDLVMIGGAPAPDGSYAFANYTVEVLMGVVTTVTPTAAAVEAKKKEDAEKEELEKKAALTKDADAVLKEENEALKKENQELKEVSTAMAAKLGDAEKVLTTLKSNGKVPDGQTKFAAKKEGEKDLKSEAAEARKRYKK